MVYLLFFLSGAAGLIYEIVWSRQLGLFFGHTVHAAAVVLAAYFAGMALGYLLAARLAPRLSRPILGYGVAELSVAAWAAATPWILGSLSNPSLAAMLNHDDPAMQLTIRAIATFLVLLPATVALGASLPFIAQHVSPPGAPRPALIALAYGWNTAGAFTGVVLATFVLILFLGVEPSGWLAAGLSAACGLAALWLGRRRTPASSAQPQPATADRPLPQASSGSVYGQFYLLAGLSGFGTLGLQVLYTRMFALTFNNSTYTFGGVVATYLIALATASWIVARRSGKRKGSALGIWACILAGPLILLSVLVFQRYTDLGYFGLDPDWLASLGITWAQHSFAAYITSASVFTLCVLFLPVVLIGLVLPWCFDAAARRHTNAAIPVGRLTAVNTIAATCGALLTSFVLLPALGLWKSFALYAVLYVVLGSLLLLRRAASSREQFNQAVLLAAVGIFTGVGAYLIQWPVTVDRGFEVLYEQETAYGVISVVDGQGYRYMRQNNHYTLGATRGMSSELRQGHIPLLLHPAPRRVAFLGLATGITASSALSHPEVEELVSIELIPEVVEAARHFSFENQDILNDQRARIVVNDARHYLYASHEQFDLIISDLFVPWHSQTGYLYTVEHYEAARQRLAPGGLFCQWVPLYQVGAREFELIADSFASVFPTTTVWRGEYHSSSPLVMLMGSEAPLKLDLLPIQQRMNALERDVTADYELKAVRELMEMYVGEWNPLRPDWLNTDGHPRVEFLAPVTQARREWLTRDRLEKYYHTAFFRLPLTGLSYTAPESWPKLDLAQSRQLQLQALVVGSNPGG